MITAVGPAIIGDDSITESKILDGAVATPKLSDEGKIKRMCSGVIGGGIPGEIVTLGKITTAIMITNIDLFVADAGLAGALNLDMGWVDDIGGGAPNALTGITPFIPGAIPAAPLGTVLPVLTVPVPIPVAGPAGGATAVMLTASALAPDGPGERVQVGIEYYEIEEVI